MAHIEVPQPGASEIVGRLLTEALSEHPDVQWLGLVSEDGFAIASEGQATVEDDAVAAGAVRMMIQVRAMAKALGQEGASQLFLEGSESGICVIDKNPWVLIMVGAPGVPIGLLRYEAREIAEAFPMARRAELTAAPADEQETPQWWSQPETPQRAQAVDETEPEIRWADEPVTDDPSGVAEPAPAVDFVVVDPDEIASGAQPAATSTEPAVSFDLAPPVQTEDEVSFDLAPPVETEDEVSFALEPVVDDEEAPAMAAGFAVEDDLLDLAPPSGSAIDLPPPSGPAFQLPPPE